MDQRQKEFEDKLRTVCPNVYFQPPPNLKMKYPCIVYKQTGEQKLWANNKCHSNFKQWIVSYISKDVLDKATDEIALWPMCEFNRTYSVNGLSHTVYYIYN